MRALSWAIVLVVISAGCAKSHLRDVDGGRAMDDARGASRIGAPCIPVLVPEGGFARSDVFVETYTPACGEPPFEGVPTAPPIGVCIVHGLEGDPRPGCTENCASAEDVAERTFCSCRCGGGAGTGPFCTCPSDARCEHLIAHDGWSGGSFCVPNAIRSR